MASRDTVLQDQFWIGIRQIKVQLGPTHTGRVSLGESYFLT